MHFSTLPTLTSILRLLIITNALPTTLNTLPDTNAPTTLGITTSTSPPSNETSLLPRSDLVKRRNGRIMVDWRFKEVNVVEDGQTTVHPEDVIIMQYFDGDASDPSCEDIQGDFIREQINGQMFRSDKCDIWAIFDGPNGGYPVSTYTSGHGVNCGWVSSEAHGHWDWFTYITDYYHDCSW